MCHIPCSISKHKQNTESIVFQCTGTLYILWHSLKMDVSTWFQLILSKKVNPCHITSPWIQGTCMPCSTAVDKSQIMSCWFSKTSSSNCAVLTCPWSAELKVQSSWWMSIHFLRPLHSLPTWRVLSTPSSYTGINWQWIWRVEMLSL